MIVSFRGRDKLVAIVPCAFSSDAADSVEMGIKVGRKVLGLTTLEVNNTLIWQTNVSVRGRDGLGSTVLGTMLSDAAVSMEMGGLKA